MSYASCRAYINNLFTVILVIGPVYILYYLCDLFIIPPSWDSHIGDAASRLRVHMRDEGRSIVCVPSRVDVASGCVHDTFTHVPALVTVDDWLTRDHARVPVRLAVRVPL